MKLNVLNLFFAFAFLGGFNSCKEQENAPPAQAQSVIEPKSEQKEKDADLEQAVEEEEESKKYISLAMVGVEVKEDVRVEASSMVEGLRIPMLEMRKLNADFVQIQRCVVSYKLQSQTGQTLADMKKNPLKQSIGQSIWDTALNSRASCTLVGEYILAGKYPDIAAETGEYYYVINPCIDKNNSAQKRRQCSYDLVKTNAIVHEAQFGELERQAAREVAAAEADLAGLIGEFKFIADKFQSNLKACEDLMAHEANLKAFKMGMINLAFFAGFASLGAMWGPNAMIMVGQMGGLMGSQLFISMVLKWDPVAANTCLDPGYAGNAEGKDGILSVTPLQNRLIKLASEELYVAIGRLKQAQDALAQFQNKVITYDEMISNASAKGIDLFSQSALDQPPSAIPGLGGLFPPASP